MTNCMQRYRVFAEWGEGLAGASKTVAAASEQHALQMARSQYPAAQVSAMPHEEWVAQHAQLHLQRLAAREQIHPHPAAEACIADECALPYIAGTRSRIDQGR